jgi:hypothetical protein
MGDGSVIVLFRVAHHELPRQMQPTILKLKVTLPIVRMVLLPRGCRSPHCGLCRVCEFAYAHFQLVDLCNSGSLRCTSIEEPCGP